MNISCVIPARGGSKGIPRKNIKELAGFPLMYHSINMAKQVFSDVYVSTEDVEIKRLALQFDAKIIDRPIELASDYATDYEWLKHAFDVLKCDNIAILRPTTPLRCGFTLLEAIQKFEENPKCSSMRSAHEAPETPYKWFELDADALHWKRNAMADLPRQVLPKVYIPNGYIDIVKRETIEKDKSAFGGNILAFITDSVVEIDSQEEFDYLEYKITNQ
jgi:CMP-N,N'-diacetyllegionaminic acid synthase